MTDIIPQRKADHIRIAAMPESHFRQKTTLLEEVELVHQALPERSIDELDLSWKFLGKVQKLPLYVSGMTGGTEEARAINMGLARVAERCGIAFGLGSQRAMLKNPDWTSTYNIRAVAPNVLLFANIGIVQAEALSASEIQAMISAVQADALCIHLNPAMELIQQEGDRDFRHGIKTIKRLVKKLSVPVIVKETGCGLSREVGLELADTGIAALDVAGAGGTSWVGIEALRATRDEDRQLGEELWDWGIPTAASLLALDGLPVVRLSSGGISTGLDVARSLALGASAAGIAGDFLKHFLRGGEEAAEIFVKRISRSLHSIALLVGAEKNKDFAKTPRVLGPRLTAWEKALRP
jgi:isopentenyl-diphosphate delta-isomerase